MKHFLAAAAMAIMMIPAASWAVTDSSGTPGINPGYQQDSVTWVEISGKPQTALRWPTWNEVTNKPAYGVRWPNWNEIGNKPNTFPPSSHNHDDRYIRSGGGTISGNLNVNGTVNANRLVTADVGGDRWCRATAAGRIMCTHDSPTAGGELLAGWPNRMWCKSSTNQMALNLSHIHEGRVVYVGTRGSNNDDVYYDMNNGNYLGKNSYLNGWIDNCERNINNIPDSQKL